MRYSGLTVVLIGICVLCMMACSSSRTATSTSSHDRVAAYEARDSSQVTVYSLQDTLREVTVITVKENERGDTIRMTMVTERDRLRDRSHHDMATYKTEVRVDTVYIEHRDSLKTLNRSDWTEKKGEETLLRGLRLILVIIVCLLVLVIVLKFRRF